MSNRSPAFSRLGLRAQPPTIARLMTLALERPGLLSLAAGFTDNATLPVAAVKRAVDLLASGPGEPEYLQYGTNRGRPGLRRQLANRLCALEPGLDPTATGERLLVTNGSQQALYLAMQVLCEPGDIVLVDRPSYFVYLEMLSGLGVRALSLPVDPAGRIDAGALQVLLRGLIERGEATRLKAVYFVSYFSNPSARSLEEEEKADIAGALSAAGLVIPVVEDAAYRELHFEVPHAVASVLSLPSWQAFPQLYLSTLTKPFATGLKIGYGVCSDPEWLARMLHVKGHHDFGSANFNQAVCEQVMADGSLDAQLARIRPAYARKMSVLHEALVQAKLTDLGWSWAVPAGGLYLWLAGPPALDTGMESAFCHACIEAGVLYVPGDLCFGDNVPRHYVRLSFGVLGEKDLIEAARRFVSVARRFAQTSAAGHDA